MDESRRGGCVRAAVLLALACPLAAQTNQDIAMQVLNRAAYGPTPTLLTQLSSTARTAATTVPTSSSRPQT